MIERRRRKWWLRHGEGRRVADAEGLVGAVFLVASKALEQSKRRQWPTIALAGRFVWKGGCGCNVCAESRSIWYLVQYCCTGTSPRSRFIASRRSIIVTSPKLVIPL